MRRIGILDIGAASAEATARAIGRAVQPGVASIVRTVAEVSCCQVLILPGGMGFGAAALQLDDERRAAIHAHVSAGKLLLGLGAGMHLLFEASTESPARHGLKLLDGRCEALVPQLEPMTRTRTKVPHLGWNRLVVELAGGANDAVPLPQGAWVYFAHRYHVVPRRVSCVAATVEYAKGSIAAAVAQDNVVGMQFSPERSGPVGTRILHAVLSRWS